MRRKQDPNAAKAARDRAQAEKFRKEAREMHGRTPRVVGVDHTATPTAASMLDEERRLATFHDASKPSACRLCGVNVEPDAAGWREVAGWKTCALCVVLLPDGLAAVLSDLVGTTVTQFEVDELTARTSLGNPSAFVTGWANRPGTATRWAQVDPALIERAPTVLAEIRARAKPRPNSYGLGCAWCGVKRSSRWVQAGFRWGKGQQAPRAAVCGDCAPWVQRARGAADWRAHLLAAATGMRRAQMGVTYDIKAYYESNPAEPSGTAEPWAYLGTVRSELRMRIARTHPRLITLSRREQRVLALQQALGEAGRPLPRLQLANLGGGPPVGAEATVVPPRKPMSRSRRVRPRSARPAPR